MSNTFCLTVLQCVPYIYSVCLELSSSEKLQAQTAADSGVGCHPCPDTAVRGEGRLWGGNWEKKLLNCEIKEFEGSLSSADVPANSQSL